MKSSHVSKEGQVSLLGLPCEVRQIILGFLLAPFPSIPASLTSEAEDMLWECLPDPGQPSVTLGITKGFGAWLSTSFRHYSIIYVCHQFYEEGVTLIYTKNQFIFGVVKPWSGSCWGLQFDAFLRRNGGLPSTCCQIRSLTIILPKKFRSSNLLGGWTTPIVQYFSNLEILRLVHFIKWDRYTYEWPEQENVDDYYNSRQLLLRFLPELISEHPKLEYAVWDAFVTPSRLVDGITLATGITLKEHVFDQQPVHMGLDALMRRPDFAFRAMPRLTITSRAKKPNYVSPLPLRIRTCPLLTRI